MGQRALIFVVFAAAMLFSMVREWSAPAACLRPTMHERAGSR